MDVVICESEWSTQVIDQARMIIHKLTMELWITIFVFTYVLYYYLLHSHNFGLRIKKEVVLLRFKLKKRSKSSRFDFLTEEP